MTCPSCMGEVKSEPICPGFYDPGSAQWMQCYPCCGKATLYECEQLVCGWWYVDNINPRSLFHAENEKKRPPWIRG